MPSIKTEIWERGHYGVGGHWSQAKLLLVRARVDLINTGDELDALFAYAAEKLIVYGAAVGEETIEFSNGFAALIYSSETVAELAKAVRPLLSRVDAWAIVAPDGQHAESVTGGPVSTFLSSCKGADFAIGLFSGVDEHAVAMLTSDVSGALKGELGRAVFHFKDGAVVLFRSKRPARMIANMAAPKARLSSEWIVIDANGDDHAGERGRACPPGDDRLGWWRTGLSGFVYETSGGLTSEVNPFLPSAEDYWGDADA